MYFIVRNTKGFGFGPTYGLYHRYVYKKEAFYFEGHGNYQTYFGVRSRFTCLMISNNILKYLTNVR